jgi:hypothetical protein
MKANCSGVNGSSNPFTTLESAQEFIALLSRSIEETKVDIDEELLEASQSGQGRRAEALNIAGYKIAELSAHTHKLSRLLNDLKMLRRVLHNDSQPSRQARREVWARAHARTVGV